MQPRQLPVTRLLLAGLCFIVAPCAVAQNYPNRPVRMIAGPPGGSSDFAARIIAQGLGGVLEQQVIVDNRSFGVMAIEISAKAAPDGYTLLYYGSALWIGPLLQAASYDAVKDFSPVTLAVSVPNLLVVHPGVAASSVKDLIALAKAKPGALNYASGESGSSGHLAAELFKAMAGVNIVRVAYKGQGPATNDLLTGQVQLTFGSAGSVAPHVKSGKMRALAVSSAQRSPAFPDLPTIAEAGVPDYESVQRSGMFAPAKTPVAIVLKLQQSVARALARSDLRDRLVSSGAEVVVSSPQEFAAKIKSEISRMGRVIKEAGIRVD
jgi:tripartite-type tricarboxylate transporter receptor subunit TctC